MGYLSTEKDWVSHAPVQTSLIVGRYVDSAQSECSGSFGVSPHASSLDTLKP